MKRILSGLWLFVLIVVLAACGASGGLTTSSGGEKKTSTQSDSGRPTATVIVLATPTPRPAPPTPTPKPSPTPLPPTATTQPTQTSPEGEMTTEAVEPLPTPTVEPLPLIDAEMVLIPAGPFTMGADNADPEDAPAHTVDLPAFEIDRFEVTNDDFAKFVAATGYVTFAEQEGVRDWRYYAEGKGNHPVVKVTWNDAVAFCEWAGKRLPTEEEWEKAARGEDGRAYPWGDDFDPNLANVKETGLRGTTAVGSFPDGASPYGVEDMGGNVWEWTASWFLPYPDSFDDNPYYGQRFRVTRGGAWFEEPPQVTTFNRNAADPEITANDDLGFRCARDAQP